MLTVVAQIIAPVALRATSALMDQIAKASFVMTNSIFAVSTLRGVYSK